MIPFLSNDFLLTTPTAKTLFHEYAAKMPIYDYHCHLDPQQIYEDVRPSSGWMVTTTSGA